jgi:UDPglucose 6-dehydrogenase
MATGSALESCRGADALAIMTPWAEFSTIDPAQVREEMGGQVVVDPFGALDSNRCCAAGLQHFRLGAPAAGQVWQE